jgi:hypothetical protein
MWGAAHLIKPEDLVWRPSRLLHEAGFWADAHAVHLAEDFVIAIRWHIIVGVGQGECWTHWFHEL